MDAHEFADFLEALKDLTHEVRQLRWAVDDMVYDLDDKNLVTRRSDKKDPIWVQQECPE
jgi:hypothetical protein